MSHVRGSSKNQRHNQN
ncbi:hypothetical protein LINPERPRIM_LOCUS5693 [Linum perenne]